jgi:hypothetical protein
MTRVIWIPAHQRRVADKDSPVHRELLEARIHDLCTKELEAALADLKPELVREGANAP